MKQFSAAADVSATLQALGSLPPSLQSLVLDGLVPLSDVVLGVVAAACPRLQALHVIDNSPSSTAASSSHHQQQQGRNKDVGVAAAGGVAAPTLLQPQAGSGGFLPHPLQQLIRLTSLTFQAGGDAATTTSSSSALGGGEELPADMERQILAGEVVVWGVCSKGQLKGGVV
jgi:hypothetical protein